MPLAPKAIRVKTAGGWQDIALQGPPGPVASVPIEPWHVVGAAGEPAFPAGWADYSGFNAQFPSAAFRKTPDGRVTLRGVVRAASAFAFAGPTNTTFFTLPVGYRPAKVHSTVCIASDGSTGVNGACRVDVMPTGVVLIISSVTGITSGAAATLVALDEIEFEVGQATFPAGAPIITPVAALPTSPTDGQEILFQSTAMATDGLIWRLRYNAASASAYKWEFVGGQELWAGHDIHQGGIVSTSYTTLANPVQVTLPLAGDWMIGLGSWAYQSGASELMIAPQFGAAAASDADGIRVGIVGASASISRTKRKTGLAAATLVNLQVKLASGTGQLIYPWLSATPVRVG